MMVYDEIKATMEKLSTLQAEVCAEISKEVEKVSRYGKVTMNGLKVTVAIQYHIGLTIKEFKSLISKLNEDTVMFEVQQTATTIPTLYIYGDLKQ